MNMQREIEAQIEIDASTKQANFNFPQICRFVFQNSVEQRIEHQSNENQD